MTKSKKILIGVAIGLAIILGAYLYFNSSSNPPLSPPGEETLTSGGITVSVSYSRPSVRGRLIFGPKENEALQPYGEYWRLGANDPTKITFNRDILFNGSPVKAGTYRMYAVPGAGSFEIVLSSEVDGSGSNEPDDSNDVLRTEVPTKKTSAPVEQFTISLAPSGNGIEMVFEWSDTRFVVPLTAE